MTTRACRSLAPLVLILFATATALSAPPEERITSKYTSTARKNAISYRKSKGEGGEADGFQGLFPGLGGYTLEYLSGDERSWINIRYGKDEAQDLYQETMNAAGGTFPNKEND